MIRRFLCLLLVPLLLANQGLSLAHSHHGTDVIAPEGHLSRPHFHFGGHSHHGGMHAKEHRAGHSHEHHSDSDHGSRDHDRAILSAIVPVGDHDADVVYVANTVTFAGDSNSPTVLRAKYIAVAATICISNQGDGLLRLGPLRQPASTFDTACPIYLRAPSLRI